MTRSTGFGAALEEQVGPVLLTAEERELLLKIGESLPLAREAVQNGCGWIYRTDTELMVIPQPKVKFGRSGEFHCGDGPAIEGLEGEKVYYWRGVRVPEAVVMNPQSLNPDEIKSEPNAEVRRVMIERYGLDRFMKDAGAVVVNEDEVRWHQATALADADAGRRAACGGEGGLSIDGAEYFLRVPPTR